MVWLSSLIVKACNYPLAVVESVCDNASRLKTFHIPRNLGISVSTLRTMGTFGDRLENRLTDHKSGYD